MASYPPSNDPNASTFNNQNYAPDNGNGLTYQQALKDFVAFPTTQSATITFPESINVGGQVECNSVLAQGLSPQISIKPTGIITAPTLTYQPAVSGGVGAGLLSSEYIYSPEMTDADIGTTNPNVLITKGYADTTYTAGTGTYASLDLANTFTEMNTFSGIGSNTSAIQITQTEIPSSGSVINMLANNANGAYNSIVQIGDASIYTTTSGGAGTGALCLTNWYSGYSGIRIASNLIQMAGFISGFNQQPLIIFPNKTSGNNPLMYFNSVGSSTSNLNVITDASVGSYSSLTQVGDVVLNANIYGYNTIYSETTPSNNLIYQYNSSTQTNVLHYLSIQPGSTFPIGDYVIFQFESITYRYIITNVIAYPSDSYILGSFVGSAPPLDTYINNFIVSQSDTTSLTAGSIVLGSYNGSGMRISPSAISFNTTPTCPTATTGDSSTKLATTAFVQTAISSVPISNYYISYPITTTLTSLSLILSASGTLTNYAVASVSGTINIATYSTSGVASITTTFTAGINIDEYIFGSAGAVNLYNNL